MRPHSFFSRKTQGRLVAFMSLAVVMISFNNCSGYKTFEFGSSESSSLGSTREPGNLPQISLLSPVSQQAAPFMVGQAFRKGDVPAGKYVGVTGADAQVTPKNFWPDGSLKFAIIAGTAAVSANAPTEIQLHRNLTSLPGTTLGVQDLRALTLTATIDAGSFGQATWTNSDWDQVFKTWVSGPRMSSFIYRKQIGSDPHLVAWLEVRIFAGGQAEIFPWIENGFLTVPGPTTKSATYRFSLNGQQKFSLAFDLPHHTRTPLINGSDLSYWTASDPQVTPFQDVKYLQATELVPTYQTPVDPSLLTTLPATYAPLQQGNFTYDQDYMPNTGYQRPIGLLPTHEVLYLLVENSKIAYESVVRNGFSAGRYPIHYRDEKTQRPLRFSSHPNLVISDGSGYKDNGASSKGQYTPTPTGTGTKTWDTAHSPSVGFVAYLITGRWYFMEETQFAATTNYLGLTDGAVMRQDSLGILHPVAGAFQTRSSAWAIRALVQALAATPDDDQPLRDEFKTSWEANISYHHNRYIARPSNPFGFIKPGEGYGSGALDVGSPWQQDFVTAAWGYALSLGLPVSPDAATKTSEFFQWKARSVVGRLGPESGFWYVNAAPYTVSFSPSQRPDWDGGTGPWHTDWKEIYKASFTPAPAWMSSTEGLLGAEYTIDSWARSMWGNLQPALAYAVRYQVPGANEAYDRMTHASNWPQLISYFKTAPVWSVVPAANP